MKTRGPIPAQRPGAVRRGAGLLLATLLLAGGLRADEPDEPGELGQPGLALLAAKALTAELEGSGVVDDAVVLVKDGLIEAVGPARSTPIPPGYEVVDLGRRWVMPGMIDLHTHIGGTRGDINDMVFQANPGLRVSSTVVPKNLELQRVLAAGVTTVLYIPGSGTNIGGVGVLLKTGLGTYEEMEVRNPGSLKIAQGDNPTRWGYGMGRGLMNFHIRSTAKKGLAYAANWTAHQQGRGPKPEFDPQFEVFRDLAAKTTQVSTHTQAYPLVQLTIVTLRVELGLDVYIDHGEWSGFLAAPLALEHGVAAIIGPREIDTPGGRIDTDGRILSCAGEYQARGMERIGFNTDAPVVPGEELPLQAAVSVRYGFDNDHMAAVRGLTIVPALTSGIAGRVGSLEPGKDADIVVIDGDPADPRASVEQVYIEGRRVYTAPEGRIW